MTRRETVFCTIVLIGLGAGWGFTQPMTKLSVSTGYPHFGLIFWQLVIGTVLVGGLARFRNMGLPTGWRHLRLYLIVAMVGTVVPNTFSYQAAVHLPSGIISILYSSIPMMAFPIALGLGLDRFEWRRFGGLLLGLVAVLMLSAPWNAGLSLGGASVIWVIVVLMICICYGFEGNYVAKWGTEGLSALQVLYGASVVGLICVTPLTLATGQWINPLVPWGTAEWALIAGSASHIFVYTGYVWLVGRAGPVFTVQVSYLVTLFGVFWAWALLSETYTSTVWFALALMLAGMYLVQPRRAADT